MKNNTIVNKIINKNNLIVQKDFIATLAIYIILLLPRQYFIYIYLEEFFFSSQLMIYSFSFIVFSFIIFGFDIARNLFFLSFAINLGYYTYITGGLIYITTSLHMLGIFLMYYYSRNIKYFLSWSFIFIVVLFLSSLFASPINATIYPLYKYLYYYDTLLTIIFMSYFSVQLHNQINHLFLYFIETNKLQNCLSSIFHHDLSNSFTGLQLNLRLKKDEENYDSIFQIIETSNNASKLGASFMDQKIKLHKFEVNKSLKSVKYNFSHLCSLKKIKLNIKTSHEKIYIKGDNSLFITSIMSNLISNAIKFSKEGSTISISLLEKNDEEITLTIKDTGIGIPAKMIPNMFDINSSTSRAGTDNEAGNGFGLVIVKSILESWNASIVVSSIINQGTEFKISFSNAKNHNTF